MVAVVLAVVLVEIVVADTDITVAVNFPVAVDRLLIDVGTYFQLMVVVMLVIVVVVVVVVENQN